jgi:transposase
VANGEIRHAACPSRRFCAAQLRSFARKTKDGPQARRLLALAAIYDGASRAEAAKVGSVTVQIVRDWVVKFNAHVPTASSTGKRQAKPRG